VRSLASVMKSSRLWPRKISQKSSGDFFNRIGQKQTFAARKAMSALPLKADIGAAFEMPAKGQ